jgi:hypothetical protein
MGKNDRIVYQRHNGDWVNKKTRADKASGIHSTQGAAAREAKQMLQNSGGGELIIKGLDGKIWSKDTIAPGHESSVKDKEHKAAHPSKREHNAFFTSSAHQAELIFLRDLSGSS